MCEFGFDRVLRKIIEASESGPTYSILLRSRFVRTSSGCIGERVHNIGIHVSRFGKTSSVSGMLPCRPTTCPVPRGVVCFTIRGILPCRVARSLIPFTPQEDRGRLHSGETRWNKRDWSLAKDCLIMRGKVEEIRQAKPQ